MHGNESSILIHRLLFHRNMWLKLHSRFEVFFYSLILCGYSVLLKCLTVARGVI